MVFARELIDLKIEYGFIYQSAFDTTMKQHTCK